MVTSYFTDSAMIRRVHREQVVGLGGGRALLMMAAHPEAFEGFFMSTSALDEPYERLRRVGLVLDTITFGSRRRADAMTARVREMHRAAGADQPELLRWILVSLVDSMLLAYERYVRPLAPAERDGYVQDYAVIGECFGLDRRHWPADHAAFAAFVDGQLASGALVVMPQARELGIEIVMRPPVGAAHRPLVELANQITIGLLPPEIRRQYGFSWDPLRGLAVRTGQEYVRRVVVPLLPERMRFVPSARAA